MSNTLNATLNPADAVLPQAPLLTSENTPLEREYLPTPGYKSAMRQRASKSRIRLTRIYGVEIEMALGEDPLRSLGIWERLQRGEEVRGTLQFDDETGEFGFHESPLGKRIRLSKTGHQGQLHSPPPPLMSSTYLSGREGAAPLPPSSSRCNSPPMTSPWPC